MNEKKHVFKMVPGKVFYKINDIELRPAKGTWIDGMLARVDFIGLGEKSDIMLDSPLEFCRTIVYNSTPGIYCIKEDEEELNLCTLKCGLDSSTQKKIYDGNLQIELKKILFSTESKGYRASISNKDGSCMINQVINRTDFDPEKSNEINYLYKFFPQFSLAYLGDKLVKLGFDFNFGREPLLFYSPLPSEYQYITLELGEDNIHQFYFSDEQGNFIEYLTRRGTKDTNISYYDIGMMQEEVILSDAFTIFLIKSLTNDQLKTLANIFSNEQLQKIIPELSSNQLEVLAEYLTDNQFRALVDHLTNHQLQTLAQELNPEKLQIIVPILNDAQLEALVRDLNPEQVREILPHLKVDQFKALIKTLNDEQFTVLAKDLAEHHLTILSKELEGDQLKALVNSLQEDQLKDLVNTLDHKKLEAIAQDLTDSNRIQMIIKSLADNPEKLQAFAHNMPDQQFAKLLNELNAEVLKDIINKLPYEKVTAVIGDVGNKDQSNAIIDALKEKFNEQNEKMKDFMSKFDRVLPEESEANWNDAHPSTYVLQDVNTEFAIIDNLL